MYEYGASAEQLTDGNWKKTIPGPLCLPQILEVLLDNRVEKTKERGKTNGKPLLQHQFHPLLLLSVILEIRKLTNFNPHEARSLSPTNLKLPTGKRKVIQSARFRSCHSHLSRFFPPRLPYSDQSYLKSSVLTSSGAIETRSRWNSKRISLSAPSLYLLSPSPPPPPRDQNFSHFFVPHKVG
jgi:hypothetical protein